MIRIGGKMKILAGMADEYKKRHDDLWPEMADMLRTYGAKNYSIFLDEETNELFSYLEIEDEALWAQSSETEICQKWWAYMADIMETNPDNSPVFKNLKSVFYFN